MKNLLLPLTLLSLLPPILAACGSSDSPASPGRAGEVSLTLTVQAHGYGTDTSLQANTIRVTVRDGAGTSLGTRQASFSGEVDDQFGPFSLPVDTPVHGGGVDVEIFHDTDPDAVLWSGTVEPVSMAPGEVSTLTTNVYRGPLSNLEITSLSLIGLPSRMQMGTSTTLSISATPAELEARPFWGSLAPEVASVSMAGVLTAEQPGETRVVVAAGPHSDTVVVTVSESEPEAGDYGASRRFDRTAVQWIEVRPGDALTFPDEPWTFSVWVRPGIVEGEWFHYAVSSGAVFEGAPGGAGPGFQIYYGETEDVHHWHVAVNNDAGEGGHHVLPANPRPTSGAWTHVALRYDGTAELTAFLNGAPRGTFEFSGSVTLPDPLNIGRRADGDPNRYLDGQIAHLARWSGALPDGEIQNLARGMHPLVVEGSAMDWFIPLGMDPESAFGTIGDALEIDVINGVEVGSSPPVNDPPSG